MMHSKPAFSLLLLPSLLLLSPAGIADAEMPKLGGKRAALENACLFEDRIAEKVSSKFGTARGHLRGAWKATREKVFDESPLCSLKTVPELLLVTSAYFGEAGLSVAHGLDKAEQALGLKRSLLEEIAALESALQGQALADQLVDRTVKLSSQIGETTRRIEQELERREREGYLTPEAKALIAQARLALSRARYFQIQALAGSTAVKQRFDRASDSEKASWVLHPEVGITGDFIKKAPGRILQATKDLAKSFTLGNKIDDAGKRLDFKIARKEIKESDQEAREDAVALAENLSFA